MRRSTPPTNGSVKALALTPLRTGIAAATVCPASFSSGLSSKTSSSTPTTTITTAPTSSACVCSAQGRKRIVATAIATKIARPPSFGVGSVCRLRSFG